MAEEGVGVCQGVGMGMSNKMCRALEVKRVRH